MKVMVVNEGVMRPRGHDLPHGARLNGDGIGGAGVGGVPAGSLHGCLQHQK